MTQLSLDTKGIYALRTINREVSFDTEGTECKGVVIIANVVPELGSRSSLVNI